MGMESNSAIKFLFYGRRKGKSLTPLARELRDQTMQRFGIDRAIIENSDLETVHPRQFFGGDKPGGYFLEIGFGAGEYLSHLAAHYPDAGLIGCEVFDNGVAKLMRRISEHGTDNIRVYNDDARMFLRKLRPQTIDRVHLFYPDPWPKKRHAKRRFLNADNLNSLARVLKPGGKLLLASDHAEYRDWCAEQLRNDRRFQPERGKEIWTDSPPEYWVATRYEEKAIREGRNCLYAALQYQNSL